MPPFSLEERGVFLLTGTIEDSSCVPAMRFIFEKNLDKSCKLKHLTLVVNSYGGYVSDGFALIDVMQGSKIPVHTLALGAIASMGLMIFLAGERGHRTVTPNTMIMSHQFAGGAWGKEHELLASQKHHDLISETIVNHYKKFTRLSEKQIREFLLPASDVWLTAKEAKKLGVCDKIADFKF
jgi:ATP-dependent Clp protease protease subunit